jgi:hypothetical protein
VNVSKPLMMRSTVVGEGGASVVDHIRTSYGTFLRCFACGQALRLPWMGHHVSTVQQTGSTPRVAASHHQHLDPVSAAALWWCIGRRGKDPIIARMERRLADWTHLGVEHQEDTQILRRAAVRPAAASLQCHVPASRRPGA